MVEERGGSFAGSPGCFSSCRDTGGESDLGSSLQEKSNTRCLQAEVWNPRTQDRSPALLATCSRFPRLLCFSEETQRSGFSEEMATTSLRPDVVGLCFLRSLGLILVLHSSCSWWPPVFLGYWPHHSTSSQAASLNLFLLCLHCHHLPSLCQVLLCLFLFLLF